MTVSVVPSKKVIAKGKTFNFTAVASGISTNISHFTYEWKKRGSDSLPDKVSGVNETELTIPNVLESDEGDYYCIVTNEWDRSVESGFANLIIYGTYVSMFYGMLVCMSRSNKN